MNPDRNLPQRIRAAWFLLALLPGTVAPGCEREGRETAMAPPARSPSAAALPAEGDWPSFLGPDRTGIARGKGWEFDWEKHPPRVLWTRTLGSGYGAGSIAGGCYYHFDRVQDEARVVCLDLISGEALWDFRYPTDYRDMYGFDNGPRASPVIDAHHVYVYGAEGQLHCLNAETGDKVWKVDTRAGFNVVQNFFGVGSTPLVFEDLLWVMVGGSPPGLTLPAQYRDMVQPDNTGMVAFDKRTGEVKVKCINDIASYASPVVALIEGKPTGLALMRSGLFAFDPRDGAALWSFPWRARKLESVNASTPMVTDAGILITESYGPGGALLPLVHQPSAADAEIVPLWSDAERRDKSIACHWNSPVVCGDLAFCSSGEKKPNAELRCVRVSDGSVLWSEPGLSRCSLTLADGHLLCLSETGKLTVLLPVADRYTPVAELNEAIVRLTEPCWAAPIAAHGLVIVRDANKVICLDLRREK